MIIKISIDERENVRYKGGAMPEGIELPTRTCKVCGHIWILRKAQEPKWCPDCKSPNWNREEFLRSSKKRAGVKTECAKEPLTV